MMNIILCIVMAIKCSICDMYHKITIFPINIAKLIFIFATGT